MTDLDLTHPWSDFSFLNSALNDKMSDAMQEGAAKAVDFVGPMMLGALVWELVSIDFSSFLSLITDTILKRRSRNEKRGVLASTINGLCFVSRLSALACVGVYLAFTKGAKANNCVTWPITMVALGAVSYTLAMTSALIRTSFLSPSTVSSKLLLVFLCFITAVTTFACIATWTGAHQSNGQSCSLTIHSPFGFFYLGPLLALLFAPLVLLISPSPSSSASSSSTSSSSSQPMLDDNKDAATPREAYRIGEAEKASEEALPRTVKSSNQGGKDSATPLSPIKDNWSQAMLKAQEKMYRSIYDDTDCDQFDILRHCLAWWFALLVVMLIGCILAFSNLSPFWILTYYPISIALCVLFMARVCRPMEHHRGLGESSAAKLIAASSQQDRNRQDEEMVLHQPRPGATPGARLSSLRPRSRTLEEQIFSALPGGGGGGSSPSARQITLGSKRDRKSASSSYHIRGNSLRDQINRIAQDYNPGRISEDIEKERSTPVSATNPYNALLADVPEISDQNEKKEKLSNLEGRKGDQKLLEEGILGLMFDHQAKTQEDETLHRSLPAIDSEEQEEREKPVKRSSVTSVVTVTALSPKTRHKALKNKERSSQSSSEDESPTSHSASIKDWTKTSSDEAAGPSLEKVKDNAKSKEVDATPTENGTASPGSRREVIQDDDTKELGRRRSLSPRSVGSSLGFVSACNEPWSPHGFAKRSSAVLPGTTVQAEADGKTEAEVEE